MSQVEGSLDLSLYFHHKNFQGHENADYRNLTVEDPGYFMLYMQELLCNYWAMFIQVYRQEVASPSVWMGKAGFSFLSFQFERH